MPVAILAVIFCLTENITMC